MVEAHKPRIVIITPPPVNEYALELKDSLEGLSEPRRTAENTQKYAQVCRQIGADVPDLLVVDIWGAMMAKAGWKEGQPLTGSKELPQSRVLQTYLVDGKLGLSMSITHTSRAPSRSCWLQSTLQGVHGSN